MSHIISLRFKAVNASIKRAIGELDSEEYDRIGMNTGDLIIKRERYLSKIRRLI